MIMVISINRMAAFNKQDMKQQIHIQKLNKNKLLNLFHKIGMFKHKWINN